MKSRIAWIDILRGIGIVLVVIGHIYSNELFFNYVYSFHVPIFFFVAGMLYKKRNILADIKRRFRTILLPYYLLGGIILIYWILVESRFRDSNPNYYRALMGLILGRYDYLDFNVHLWFLPCFFITVVIYNICTNLLGKKNTIIISVLMTLAFIVFPKIPQMIMCFNYVFKYIGFMAFGNLISCQFEEIDRKIKKWKLLFFSIFALLCDFFLVYLSINTGIMWFVDAMLGVIGITILTIVIKKSKILEYLGSNSLIILCIHGPVYRICIKICALIFKTTTDIIRSNFVLSAIILISTLGICLIVNVLGAKVLHNVKRIARK